MQPSFSASYPTLLLSLLTARIRKGVFHVVVQKSIVIVSGVSGSDGRQYLKLSVVSVALGVCSLRTFSDIPESIWPDFVRAFFYNCACIPGS